MAINRKISRKRSFGDIYLEMRVSEDEPLLKIDRVAQETGLWRAVEKELEKMYSSEGRPGFPPLLLFKCLILELMYKLSDRDTERVLMRDMLFMRFVGLGMDDPVPDHSTLSKFRERMEGTGILERAMEYLENALERKGLKMSGGAIIDATIVPSERKNDPDGRWVKRGNKSRFGFKTSISIDRDTMMVRRVVVSPADEHDTLFFDDVLPQDVYEVFADKGYDDDARRRSLRSRGIMPRIMRKARRGKPLSEEEKALNKLWAKKRARVETAFGNLKNLFGLAKARWKGLRRFCLQSHLSCLAWNLFHGAKLLCMG